MSVNTLTKRHAWTLQIRALHDANTITVYQAYSATIADAAIASQTLSSSPNFNLSRMTWIKPSWTWMLYRSGYATKDPRQARILAIRMTRDGFHELLRSALLTGEVHADATKTVRVQWDPERTPRLEKIPDVRSIQVGISREWVQPWIERMIVDISDVTHRATELSHVLDTQPDVGDEELRERGLLPDEQVYELPDDIREAVQRRSNRNKQEEALEEDN